MAGTVDPASAAAELPLSALRLSVGGQVQGVGFRPFVYRLALSHGLSGWVRNDLGRVTIQVQGAAASLDAFCRDLIAQAPAIARPQLLSRTGAGAEACDDFRIVTSAATGQRDIHLPPDYFTCPDCRRELNDPADRRYRYPFINCTQCGPRYTLIERLPYDRPNTAMAGFALCPICAAEYADPADRRFHAEPLACPVCGPRLWFVGAGQRIDDTGQALDATMATLREGLIVAVKGVGGYHLLCDAANDMAIDRLRATKPRPDKPLAVLFPERGADGLAAVRACCEADAEQAALLTGPARPIVLLPLRDDSPLSAGLAPGLAELGVMLPYSPLHHLLLQGFDGPLVATSANLSGEPVLTGGGDVETRLGHVADACLHHDRPIVRPADDSVYRSIGGRCRPLRLGRGVAPLELPLARPLPRPLLAVGGHMKNSIALAWDDRVVMSPHIGELGSPRGLDVFGQVIADLQSLYGVHAEAVACDAHPGYASSRWARASGLPVLPVLHHHAHAAQLAAEYPDHVRWLVFTWDGVGYGEDGSLWGGEALLGNPGDWQRVASLRPFRPPGGEQAGRAPWRSALALCWEAGVDWPGAPPDSPLLQHAWRRGLNSPVTSAAGRLFDAAAALTGMLQDASFEGQGPMLLEAAASDASASSIAMPLAADDDGIWRGDWAPLLPMLLDAGLPVAERAACFHTSLAQQLVDQACRVREQVGDFTVGLSGGVFQNRLLTGLAMEGLQQAGFEVHMPLQVPVNDGGICLGQMIEAATAMS